MSTAPGKLAICLLASEVAPLSKTGGLADVAAALAKYLHADRHDVRLVTPCYSSIDRAALGARPVAALQQVPLALGAHQYVFSVLEAALPGAGGARVLLIDCPALYARASLYTADPDEHLRFIALTRAALMSCARLKWPVQIFHCNDWHTAFAPLFLRTDYAKEALFAAARTVLTIHNIGYQGIFPASEVADLDLPPGDTQLLHQDDLRAGHINALRQGILYADAITTVSPTHAHEICTAEYGMGLEDSLRARGAALTGILNGVDYDEWDPRRDRLLPIHYDPDHLEGKRALKRELRAHMRLDGAPEAPLAGVVSRLAMQKGIELMFEALPKVMSARPLTLAVLGSGEAKYEQFFTALTHSFPGRVAFVNGYDEVLSHWIEAGSDLFLMPSRYEPCGLNQMYSLRYGTVPVVRRTGGLADSVEHYDPASGSGTGVVFNDFDPPALEWAVNFALDLYGRPQQWSRLMRNGMLRDFSWQRATSEYEAVYRRLTGA
ncbi:MAG TPA: glycogen synthase GlgA [Steroidobacteraceae bacterium]|nr:glycogen synthase GlgA [Steroidobacteraceae bacterium]